MRRNRHNPLGVSWVWWALGGAGLYFGYIKPKQEGRPPGLAPAIEGVTSSAKDVFSKLRGGLEESTARLSAMQTKKGARVEFRTLPGGNRVCVERSTGRVVGIQICESEIELEGWG